MSDVQREETYGITGAARRRSMLIRSTSRCLRGVSQRTATVVRSAVVRACRLRQLVLRACRAQFLAFESPTPTRASTNPLTPFNHFFLKGPQSRFGGQTTRIISGPSSKLIKRKGLQSEAGKKTPFSLRRYSVSKQLFSVPFMFSSVLQTPAAAHASSRSVQFRLSSHLRLSSVQFGLGTARLSSAQFDVEDTGGRSCRFQFERLKVLHSNSVQISSAFAVRILCSVQFSPIQFSSVYTFPSSAR